MKEQTAIEKLRKYLNDHSSTGSAFTQDTELVNLRIICKRKLFNALIQSAISEAEKRVDDSWDATDQGYFYVGEDKTLYDNFEDWQSKHGTKL